MGEKLGYPKTPKSLGRELTQAEKIPIIKAAVEARADQYKAKKAK